MSLRNFISLAGIEVTEKFDSIYFFGCVGGRVAGESEIKANLSLSLKLSLVGAELGNTRVQGLSKYYMTLLDEYIQAHSCHYYSSY